MSNPSGPITLSYMSGGIPRRHARWQWFLAASPLAVLAALALLPFTATPRCGSNRVKCQSNMRQIGQAILLYTNDFGGRYPDSLGDLLLTEDITSEAFVCPSTTDTPARGPTTQAVVAGMSKPGHLSYIYVGKGFDVKTVRPDAVILYEPISNDGGGMNVLFGDGHIEFISAGNAATILRRLKAGVSPVRWPSTQPVSGG